MRGAYRSTSASHACRSPLLARATKSLTNKSASVFTGPDGSKVQVASAVIIWISSCVRAIDDSLGGQVSRCHEVPVTIRPGICGGTGREKGDPGPGCPLDPGLVSQPRVPCLHDGLGPVGDLQLGQDVRHMIAYRLLAQPQLGRDRGV